jgi:ankyrin repeat protein
MEINIELNEIVDHNGAKIFVNPIKEAIDNDNYRLLDSKLEGIEITKEMVPATIGGGEVYINIIHYCAFMGALNCLRYMVDRKGIDIKIYSENNSNLLHFLSDKSLGILDYCIKEKKLNINVKNKINATPLMYAAKYNQLKIAEHLIKLGAKPNLLDKKGAISLHYAAENNNYEMLNLLIKAGAKVNYPDKEGLTPLHVAVYMGHVRSVATLLNANAEVNAKNFKGWTPLHYASIRNFADAAYLLIKKRADLNIQCKHKHATPLSYAADSGYKDIVELLVKGGARQDISSKDKSYPINYAAARGHTEICKFLIHSGAYIDQPNSNGSSPLYLASLNGHTDTVKALCQLEAGLNSLNKDRLTPLDIAVKENNLGVMHILLNQGAKGTTRYNENIFTLAAKANNYEASKLLLMKGIEVIDSNLYSPKIRELSLISQITDDMLDGNDPSAKLLLLKQKFNDKAFLGDLYDILYMRLNTKIVKQLKTNDLDNFVYLTIPRLCSSIKKLTNVIKVNLLPTIIKSVMQKSLDEIFEFYKVNGLPANMSYESFQKKINSILISAKDYDLIDQVTKLYLENNLVQILYESDNLLEFIFLELLCLPKVNSAISLYNKNYYSDVYDEIYNLFDKYTQKIIKNTLRELYNTINDKNGEVINETLDKAWSSFVNQAAIIHNQYIENQSEEWDAAFIYQIKNLSFAQADTNMSLDEKKSMLKMAIMFHSLFPEYYNIKAILGDRVYLDQFKSFCLNEDSPLFVVKTFIDLLSQTLLPFELKTSINKMLNEIKLQKPGLFEESSEDLHNICNGHEDSELNNLTLANQDEAIVINEISLENNHLSYMGGMDHTL